MEEIAASTASRQKEVEEVEEMEIIIRRWRRR